MPTTSGFFRRRKTGRLRQSYLAEADVITSTAGSMMFRKLQVTKGPTVTVLIDGNAVMADIGESVASVFVRQPSVWTRTTPLSESRRAPFCMMGACYDCLATVDGVSSVQTCLTPVRDGMRIERQRGLREVKR